MSTRQNKFILTLCAKNRWLLTGTPVNMRPDDLRGQVAFLQMNGLEGYFWADVDNVILKSNRKWENYNQLSTSADYRLLCESDDVSDDTLRGRWYHRTANTIFQVIRKCMIRHSKYDGYNGRTSLLTLPPKDIKTTELQFSSDQRAVYSALYKHARSRYERLKQQGLAVARVIQVVQMLMPVRQACSGGTLVVRDALQRMENEVVHDDMDEKARKNKQAVLELNLENITVATEQAVQSLSDEVCTYDLIVYVIYLCETSLTSSI